MKNNQDFMEWKVSGRFFFMAHLLPGSCHPRHGIFGENDCSHLDVPLEVRINGDRINGLVISPTYKWDILGL